MGLFKSSCMDSLVETDSIMLGNEHKLFLNILLRMNPQVKVIRIMQSITVLHAHFKRMKWQGRWISKKQLLQSSFCGESLSL